MHLNCMATFIKNYLSFILDIKKAPTLRSRPQFLSPLSIKRWCQPFGLHTRSLTNRFVCNFLSSSAGLNLCSCFFRLTLAIRFRFRLSLGFHFHGLAPLPLLFLTPAVFACFRSLQFWVLTTQPLFLPFPLLPVSASQWLPQCALSAFASLTLPVLSDLVSRAFSPGSSYSASCLFPFAPP